MSGTKHGRRTARTAAALVTAITAAGTLAPVGAQDVRAQIRVERPQAWIGISVESRQTWLSGGQSSGPVVVVTAVHPGGPAHRAGFQVGDTLISVNGRPAAPEAMARLQSALTPGSTVSVALRRDGRVRNVSLEAVSRPADELLVTLSPAVRVRLDSAHAAFARHLESGRGSPPVAAYGYRSGDTLHTVFLRRFAGQAGQPPSFFPATGDPAVVAPEGTLVTTWRIAPSASTVDALGEPVLALPDPSTSSPFSSLLVQDARSEELVLRLRDLDERVRKARLTESLRMQELARALDGGRGRIDLDDPVLRRERSTLEALRSEAEAVRTELERLALRTLERPRGSAGGGATQRNVTVSVSPRRGTPVAAGGHAVARLEETSRPLAPYLVGRDRVAGARLTPINPQLGAYFGSERGLLVVDVGGGTPAADAGIEPGDVILSIAGREVSTVDEARLHLAEATPGPEPVAVALLRKGRRLTVVLPQ